MWLQTASILSDVNSAVVCLVSQECVLLNPEVGETMHEIICLVFVFIWHPLRH